MGSEWTTIELIRNNFEVHRLARMNVNALHQYRRELSSDVSEVERLLENFRSTGERRDIVVKLLDDLKAEHQHVLDELEARNKKLIPAKPIFIMVPARKKKLPPTPKPRAQPKLPAPPPSSPDPPPSLSSEPPITKLSWGVLNEKLRSFPVMRNYLRLNYTPAAGAVMELERLEYLYSLSPSDIYMGKDEFQGYFVLYFAQHQTAVFECPVVGNALYLVRGSWQIAARKSKAELLHTGPPDVRRIIHVGEWRKRLLDALTQS